MFSTGVLTAVGWTVLIWPNARPRRPLDPVSETNSVETWSASSIAWCLTVRPPMVRLSVPTVPEAEEWSQNVMSNVEPAILWKLEDFVGSKTVW